MCFSLLVSAMPVGSTLSPVISDLWGPDLWAPLAFRARNSVSVPHVAAHTCCSWQERWAVPEMDIPMPDFGRDVGVVRERSLTCFTTVNFTLILFKLLHSSFDVWRTFANDLHEERNICQLFEYSHIVSFFLLKHLFLWDWSLLRWSRMEWGQGVWAKRTDLKQILKVHCVFWQIVLSSFYHGVACLNRKHLFGPGPQNKKIWGTQ